MKNDNKGFTLVEVIIVVAVLAAVITIATPDINRLFAKQEEMTESFRMKNLRDALEAYSKDKQSRPAKAPDLPDESSWVDDLLPYTELTKEQIRKNIWGEERAYARIKKEHKYLGGTYDVYYGVITSVKPRSGVITDASAILPTNYDQFKNFEWTNSIAENSDLIDSEDITAVAIKYTDQPNKIKLMETTLERMDKLSLALAKYARVKQISGVTTDPDKSDSFIYFPQDGRSGDPGNYYRPGTTEGVGTTSGSPNDAKELAVLLGLPEEYGVDALTGSNMWYIANPGPDATDICNGSRSAAPFYPPVIMIDRDSNPC